MKKPICMHSNKHRSPATKTTPARIILYSTSLIMSLMYISAAVILTLPENYFSQTTPVIAAADIFESSSRVAALGAIFITIAALLEVRFSDSSH